MSGGWHLSVERSALSVERSGPAGWPGSAHSLPDLPMAVGDFVHRRFSDRGLLREAFPASERDADLIEGIPVFGARQAGIGAQTLHRG